MCGWRKQKIDSSFCAKFARVGANGTFWTVMLSSNFNNLGFVIAGLLLTAPLVSCLICRASEVDASETQIEEI